MLAVHQLTLARGRSTLIKGLTASFLSQQLWLLEGPNGSGKTTLLRALAGLTPGDEGAVLWGVEGDSADVRNNASYAHRMAWCPHHAPWKDEFTVDENLRFALSLAGVSHNDESRHISLRDVGLANKRLLLAKRLSQGQRKRLVLAWLSLVNRPLWLMDEPQNALDAAGQDILQAMLARHVSGGGTAIIATHLPLHLDGIVTGRIRLGDTLEVVDAH